MIETLLKQFQDEQISIQITLDLNKPVTVHAFDPLKELHETKGDTVIEALKRMEIKLLTIESM